MPYWVAGAAFVLCALISFVAFDGVPHLDDIMYLTHANYFADGMLTLPMPVSTEAFDHYLMDSYQDKWFTVNLPGWPMALAIVWGLSFSTILVLLLVPALYLINDDIQRGIGRLLGRDRRKSEEPTGEVATAAALRTETG